MEDFDEDLDDTMLAQMLAMDQDGLDDVPEETKLAGFDIKELKSWEHIRLALESVENVQELKDWARSPLFRPHFLHYYSDAILPLQTQGETIPRGESFTTIVLRLETAALSGDTRYNDLKHWPLEWKQKLVWAIIRLVRLDFAKTRIAKGIALLNLTGDIADSIRKKVGAVNSRSASPAPLLNLNAASPAALLDPQAASPAPLLDPQAASPSPPASPSPAASRKRGKTLKKASPAITSAPRTRSQAKRLNQADTETIPATPLSTITPSNAEPASSNLLEEDTPGSKAPHWKEELIPATKRDLKPISQTPDLNKKFWQYHLIECCLQKIETQIKAEELDGEREPETPQKVPKGKPTNKQDKQSMTPFKVLEATALTSSVYKNSLDNLIFAQQTVETISTLHANTLGGRPELIQPTQESVRLAQTYQEWTDCSDFQPQNHEEACEKLKIANPEYPKLESMRINARFRFWQPVAVYAIHQFRQNELLRGCLLADVRATISKEKPTLIICPPHLVWQWASEIMKITSKLKVMVYFGDAREVPPVQVKVLKKLTSTSPWLNSEQAHHGVVITSFQTLAQRHGPAARDAWRDGHSTPWPGNLEGIFDTLVIDEAHALRNRNTAQWTAVSWVDADWNILATGTPMFNSAKDFGGLYPFLFAKHNQLLWSGVAQTVNPFSLPADDPKIHLCLTPSAVDKWILQDNLDNVTRGLRMRQVWKSLIIRRTLSSSVGGKRIGNNIPPTQYRMVFVRYSVEERVQYDKWWKQLRRNLFVKTREGQLVWNMAKFRELTLITTWLWFRYCHHILVKASMRVINTQATKLVLAPQLITKCLKMEQAIAARKREIGGDVSEEAFSDIPQSFTDEQCLMLLLRGSPKLRALLNNIQQEVFLHNEKSIVWCTTPSQQAFISAALHHCHIDNRMYHAELTTRERVDLAMDFTTKPDSCMVLVCSYYVNSAGSSLQHLCRNVHLFDTPSSEPMKEQAIGRSLRVGQTRTVKIYNYVVEDSFNTNIFARNLNKAVPELVATMNWSVFADTLDIPEGDLEEPVLNIGVWVKNQDGTVSKVRHAPTDTIPENRRLSAEAVIQVLMSTMKAGVEWRELSDLDMQYLKDQEDMAAAEEDPASKTEGSASGEKETTEMEDLE
ncbi:P-loop containing nucleoside triphosphate hydrolase protein [Aspergillus granulosus]|uniref:P-loop containing nucleoside triphosphate hydrolase protein n=1 Tax=Aspergillus granulosus TaxID=176169 RepID=A0ABR4GSZ9_9EURO